MSTTASVNGREGYQICKGHAISTQKQGIPLEILSPGKDFSDNIFKRQHSKLANHCRLLQDTLHSQLKPKPQRRSTLF